MMIKLLFSLIGIFTVLNAAEIDSTQSPTLEALSLVSGIQKADSQAKTSYIKLDSNLSADLKKSALKKAQREANQLTIEQGFLIYLGGLAGSALGFGISSLSVSSCVAESIVKSIADEKTTCGDKVRTMLSLSVFAGSSLGVMLGGHKNLSTASVVGTLGASFLSSYFIVSIARHPLPIIIIPPLSAVLGYAIGYDNGIKVLEAQAKLIDKKVIMNYELIGYSFNF